MTFGQRIFGLDLLRATAVLFVVFHHTIYFSTAPHWLYSLGWLGETGVGALLVLSGYLIGQGLIKKSKDGRFSGFRHLGRFYARRWSRTFPPYFFYLLMMAALVPPIFHQLYTHWTYFFFLQNFAWDVPPFYAQTWTLAVLEFFYLLFPLLLILTSKLIRNYWICLAVPMAVLFFVPLLLRAFHSPIESPLEFEASFRKWIIYRLDTPIIGVAAALIQFEMPQLWAWFLRRSWIGFSTFSATMVYQYLHCPYLYSSHWLQVFFYPIAALLTAPLFPFLCAWKSNRSYFGSLMSSISQGSYSLYCSHMFALSIGFCVLLVLGIPATHWFIAYPIYLLLIVGIAYPSYYLTEEPFIRLRENDAPSCLGVLGQFGSGVARTFFSALLIKRVNKS